jgi:hypothetical protein
MIKLDNRIQKEHNLNDIYSVDKIGPGGARHKYAIYRHGTEECVDIIRFQKGPRCNEDSIDGILDTDLLEIVRDRLKAFQAGEFACDYNAAALHYVEEALIALRERVDDRVNRNVLGKNEK